MSGDVDPEDKTEEPTEKRLHDAVERGEVAFSREAPLFASLSATLLVLIFVIPARAEALLTALVGLIDDPAGWRIERGEDVLAIAGPLVSEATRFLLPTVIILTAAGVLASVAQSPPRIVPERILPDASRISLRKGLSRVFGARGWTEFLKSLIKLAAVIAVAADDADRPEGRTAHGDGRRPGHAACSACSTSPSKRSPPCSSRRLWSRLRISPGRVFCGGATTG